MKLGFFTDVHARSDSPRGRIDDFRKSLFIKLEEVGQTWKDNQVEYVLFGGDLFDSPDPSNSVKYDMMHVLKSWKLPIIGIIGSHDYFGYQMKTLKRTAVGILYKAEIIQLVGGGAGFPAYIELEGKKNITIVGTPHTYWLADNPEHFNQSLVFGENFQIQLVHGDLLDKPVPWQHVLVNQVNTNSDLTLSGHFHPGWEKPIINGKMTFVNPGSIARLENTGKRRIPRVCIIDVDENNKFKVEYKKLMSALEHPFIEKEVVDEETNMQDVTKLLQLLETTKTDPIDIKNQLQVISKELGMSDAVLEKAFEMVEKAKNN